MQRITVTCCDKALIRSQTRKSFKVIDTDEITARCQIRVINNYSGLFTANSQLHYALYTESCRLPIGSKNTFFFTTKFFVMSK